jgi:hypothetical protein
VDCGEGWGAGLTALSTKMAKVGLAEQKVQSRLGAPFRISKADRRPRAEDATEPVVVWKPLAKSPSSGQFTYGRVAARPPPWSPARAESQIVNGWLTKVDSKGVGRRTP